MRRKASNRFSQLNIADAPVGRTSGREIQTLEAASFRKEGMIHFLEVMILGRQPENRNGVHAALGQFAGHVTGRERFINAVGGPAEQSNLLPRDYRVRAISQPVQISSGGIVSAKNSILFPQRLRNGAADGILEPHLTRGFVDSICRRRMPIEFRDTGKIGEECGIKSRGSRQLGPL